MDHFLTFRPKCKEDIITCIKHVKEFCIYELLAGLNLKYDQLRVNILGKDPLPSLNEVYAYLHREEKCRNTLVQPTEVQHSTLISSSERW